jgi:hypothetical protein
MGKSEKAYQQLFKTIRENWEAIAHKVIEKLVKSIDSRVNIMLDTEG